MCYLRRGSYLVVGLALCWLWMMIVHEGGHVTHALLSGGRVTGVVLHPLAFSRTDVDPNPHPTFVTIGGLLWGWLLPLLVAIGASRLSRGVSREVWFFAGFCLVANGAYAVAGGTIEAGDIRDLQDQGVPLAPVVIGGLGVMAAGLTIWHQQGKETPPPPSMRRVAALSALLACTVGGMLLL